MLWLIVESWWAGLPLQQNTTHTRKKKEEEKNGMIAVPFIIDNRNLRGHRNVFFSLLISLSCKRRIRVREMHVHDSILIRFFFFYISSCFSFPSQQSTLFGKRKTKPGNRGHVGVNAVVNPCDARELRFCSVFPSFFALWSSTDNDDDHQLKRERP